MFWNFLKDNDIHQLKTFNLNFANFSNRKKLKLVNYLVIKNIDKNAINAENSIFLKSHYFLGIKIFA